MTKGALKLARDISIGVIRDRWDHPEEKIASNSRESLLEHPDNIWYFWNQFDPFSQDLFFERVNQAKPSKAKDELLDWFTADIDLNDPRTIALKRMLK
ncbi:MAG: hypothetical protein M0R80_18505 [Proteobacteria bacterium]|jgi:hypothetical protein|nr:hypothetical protein [Pseudomonadota bacterium]